jgi:hypothetical protein
LTFRCENVITSASANIAEEIMTARNKVCVFI